MQLFRAVKSVLPLLTKPRHFSKDSLLISAEVSEALSSNSPVVALESAVLTHGLPYPHNLSAARAMEALIRRQGAVPATTALLDGTLRVGVSRAQLERLCTPDRSLVKVSRRDLAPCMSAGLSGGTTVSGGMILAHWAGIKLFVTGGLGGVHEGGEKSMDVSADLTEMGRTPLAVVCAGVKSILDVERTLEVLETQGVTVCTLGADQIPGFFSPSSGVNTPLRVDSISDVSKIISTNHQMGLNSGVLICVPIPEAESVAMEEIDQLIASGMSAADSSGVKGRDLTPFLLEYVREGTHGRSLRANLSLLKNNAVVGGQIATCLSHSSRRGVHTCAVEEAASGRPVVVGAINLDLLLRVESEVARHQTNEGWIRHSLGGVGRNLAQCLTQVGPGCDFVSVVGRDAFGDLVLSELADPGRVRRVEGARTAKYCSLLDQAGELMYGIADMEVLQSLTPQVVDEISDLIARSPLVVFDGNLPHATLSHLLQLCAANRVPTWFEPTCTNKATKFLSPSLPAPPLYPSFISPNLHELLAIHRVVLKSDQQAVSPQDSGTIARLCSDLLPYVPVILLTRGDQGVLLSVRHQDMLRSTRLLTQLSHEFTPVLSEHFRSYHFPAVRVPVSDIVSVSGAGDCLAGTVISGLTEGRSLEEAVSAGMKAASLSLQSTDTVPSTLSPQLFLHTSTAESQHS